MKFRKMISTLLIIISLGGVLVGCSDNSNDNASGSFDDDINVGDNISGSNEGGHIVVPTEEIEGSLNPVFTGLEKVNLATNILYTPLYIYEAGNITCGLANSVEFKDNKELTIKLKEGLTWHDGKPITSEDVVYTLNLILDKNQGSMLREYLLVDDKPVEVLKEDDLTIKIILPVEKAGFLHNISRIAPIPSHIYKNEKLVSSSEKNKNPIGSGPFKFKEIKEGESITFERFDDYVGGKPKAEFVTIKLIPEDKQEVALENKEISLMEGNSELYKKAEKDDSNLQTYTHCAGRLNFLAFNENTPSMKNVDFRKALAFTLSRKKLIAAAYDGDEKGAKEAKTILLPSTDFYYDGDEIEDYKQDLDKAKEYLKSSGLSLGVLTLGYNNEENGHKEYASEVANQLKALGIDVAVKGYSNKEFQEVLVNRKSECNMYITSYELGGNPEDYKEYFSGESFSKQWGYKNEAIDKLWKEAEKEQDNEKRKKIYTDIQMLLAEDAAIYPIDYERTIMIALKSLKGIDSADPRGKILFRDWSKLYIAN